MKERIVITDDKFVRQAHNSIIVGCPLEFEQVPETFEELKELCKELNNKIKDIQVSCAYEKHIVIQWYNDDNTDIDVYDDGTICVENHIVAENRTTQQMWNIIKSLIGE